MASVRVDGFTVSLDGYAAGPDQDLDHPPGVGGTDLHQWLFPTRTLQRALFGKDGGTTGLDDELHLAIAPVLPGRGERLFDGVDLRASGFECEQFVASELATHVVLRRKPPGDTPRGR